MERRLAGHALVEALLAQGIDTVFGVPGESYLAVLDGLHQYRERIRFITCRHEGGAAFMAEAQGKLTGRPGICMVTRAPGAANAAIGLHTALQDSTPMVLLIGQVASDQRDREAFQEVDYRQMFGPGTLGMAKWAAQVDSADRLPEYVARAFRTAMQGRPGPVVLALPEDMLSTPTSAPVLPRVEPVLAWPAPGALRELRSLLLASQRPLVLAGGSGWTAESAAALQRFAENWQLPVACGFRFQDTFDNHHPLYAGDVGIGINPALAARVRQADLLLAVGLRLGEMTTGGYALVQAPRPTQKLVHVHAGPEELGRVYAADLMLQAANACAGKALETLAAPPDVPWRAWAAQARADYETNQRATPAAADAPSAEHAAGAPEPGVVPEAEPIHMPSVIQTLQRLVPRDTVYTNGAGNFSGWLHRFARYAGLQHHGRTQLACTSGAMGYGLPAAVAAALLQPDRQVVHLAGDGDFLMTLQDMVTARAHGVKHLLTVLVDNASYGTIRMHQEREFPARVIGSDLHNPDFVGLAQACGWHAQRVERTDAFEPAAREALAAGRPALLHLILPVDCITSRSRLQDIRAIALRRQSAID
jgi:acetolactate synthase-1/2/3 large subunit